MKLSATTTGVEAIKQRMAALVAARNVVGEVYWDGARNAKLGQIHAAGAILRSGAVTHLRREAVREQGTDDRRGRVIGRVLQRRDGRTVARGTFGVLPSRNPFFTQPAVAASVLRLFAHGVKAIVEGRSRDFAPTMALAAELVAKGMQRNLAPEGRLSGAHVGLHMPAGTAVGAGSKMQKLSAAYAKQKLKAVGPAPVLKATGELWASIKSRVVRA